MQLPVVGISAVFFVIFPSSARRGILTKQPVLGILATIIVIAVSLTLISFFDFPTFAGWVSYSLMCLIPMQIVVGVTWGTNQPSFAAKQRQPLKGILLAITTAVIGAIVLAASLAVAGGNVTPPAPMLVHVTITSVVVTFWGAIIFGGWPFKPVIKNEVAAGLTLLAACYVVNYLFLGFSSTMHLCRERRFMLPLWIRMGCSTL